MEEVVKLFSAAFEQVPKSRSTMMSLNSLFNDIGNVIAPAVGGALLVFTSGIYGVVGLALGSITVAGSAVLLFLAKDPTRAPVGLP
jgi:predicted MFS family arabinose efflux permease